LNRRGARQHISTAHKLQRRLMAECSALSLDGYLHVSPEMFLRSNHGDDPITGSPICGYPSPSWSTRILKDLYDSTPIQSRGCSSDPRMSLPSIPRFFPE